MTAPAELQITAPDLGLIRTHAQAAAPQECVGLIYGQHGPHHHHAHQILPLRNVSTDPENQYQADQTQQHQVQAAAEDAGLQLVGIYHSHPSNRPDPSPEDVRLHAYPDAFMVIVGTVEDGGSLLGDAVIGAWRVRDGRVLKAQVTVIGTWQDMADVPATVGWRS